MKWNLQNLYSSLESWKNDYERLDELINEMGKFQGKLGEYEGFLAYHKLQKESIISSGLQ